MLKAGTIAFNGAGGISCIVRNMSPAGACLEVESQVGIPDWFILVIRSDRLQRRCRIVWRKGKRLGVAFDAAQAASNAI